jgi:hypothetical protein
MTNKNNVIDGEVIPLRDNILATDLEFGAQVINGIIIPNDDMTERGIKSRWAKVYKIGPDVTGIEVGNWILIEHSRWSTGFNINEGNGNVLVRWVEYKSIELVTDEKPEGFTATL